MANDDGCYRAHGSAVYSYRFDFVAERFVLDSICRLYRHASGAGRRLSMVCKVGLCRAGERTLWNLRNRQLAATRLGWRRSWVAAQIPDQRAVPTDVSWRIVQCSELAPPVD